MARLPTSKKSNAFHARDPMTLYSYTVRHDYGFAPNPFFGFCTLATCKPLIRAGAQVGDYIVGLGARPNGEEHQAVYLMQVSEITDFDTYWDDPRFYRKRPNLFGSLKVAFGDNIYHRGADGTWIQADSHHSYPDGSTNFHNLRRDTFRTRHVLIGNRFSYFGRKPTPIPEELFNFNGETIAVTRGHHNQFSEEFLAKAAIWIEANLDAGVVNEPHDWRKRE